LVYRTLGDDVGSTGGGVSYSMDAIIVGIARALYLFEAAKPLIGDVQMMA